MEAGVLGLLPCLPSSVCCDRGHGEKLVIIQCPQCSRHSEHVVSKTNKQGLLDSFKFSESIFFLFNLNVNCHSRWKYSYVKSEPFFFGNLWVPLLPQWKPLVSLFFSPTLTTYHPGHSVVRHHCSLGICTCKNFLLHHSLFTCSLPPPIPRVCLFVRSIILIIQLYPLFFLHFSGYSGLSS